MQVALNHLLSLKTNTTEKCHIALHIFHCEYYVGSKTAATIDMTFPYALVSVIILGSLGNSFVIFSIFRQKNLLKNNHYYLVLHLAVCDLLNLLGATIITGMLRITSPVFWQLAIVFFLSFSVTGVLFMVLMSMLRYRAVFYPLRPQVNRWILYLASTFLDVFGILCQIPQVIPSKFRASETFESIYRVFNFTVLFFIPVVFLGLIYWKICSELMKQGKIIKSMNASNTTEEKERRFLQRLAYHRNARAFGICFMIFVCFLVAESPMQIAFILFTFNKVELDTYYYWFVVMFCFGVSAVNPLIYGASDKKLFSSFKLLRIKITNRSTDGAI